MLGNTEPSGLDEFLKSFNLAIGSGLVVDPRFNFNREPGPRFRPDFAGGEAPDRRSAGDDSGRAHAGRGADSSVRAGDARARRRPSRLIPTWSRRRSCGPPNTPGPRATPRTRRCVSIPKAATSPARSWSAWRSPQRPEKARPGDAAEGKPRLVLFSSPAMAENVYQEIEQTNLDLLDERRELAAEPARHPGNPSAYPCRAHAVRRSVLAVAADPGPVGRGRDVDHRHGDHCLHRPAAIMKSYLQNLYLDRTCSSRACWSMWGLEHAGVRTENERRLRETRILPELIDVPEAERAQARDRTRDRSAWSSSAGAAAWGAGRWSSPRTWRPSRPGWRRWFAISRSCGESLDSGSVTGPADTFGLAPPVATVSLWGETTGEASDKRQPIATLALRQDGAGQSLRSSRRHRSDRGRRQQAIERGRPAGGRLARAGRDGRADVSGRVGDHQTSRARSIRAERDERGRWRLTAPVHAPANPAKIESLLSALSSLRVVDGEKGFVADNVKDFAPFGLADAGGDGRADDDPADRKSRSSLHVGKPVPDRPDRVYVRQGDQDDVVIVDAKALAEVPKSAVALRSQQVADIDPAAVTQIEIQAGSDTFSLKKGAERLGD